MRIVCNAVPTRFPVALIHRSDSEATCQQNLPKNALAGSGPFFRPGAVGTVIDGKPKNVHARHGQFRGGPFPSASGDSQLRLLLGFCLALKNIPVKPQP